MRVFFITVIAILFFAVSSKINPLLAKNTESLLVIGGGYLDAKNYRGSLIQFEYKYENCLWQYLRPQITFLLSNFNSGYLGFGVGSF